MCQKRDDDDASDEDEDDDDDNDDDDDDERDRDHGLYHVYCRKLPMDLDPLLGQSQGFFKLVLPLSSEQIAMPAASE